MLSQRTAIHSMSGVVYFFLPLAIKIIGGCFDIELFDIVFIQFYFCLCIFYISHIIRKKYCTQNQELRLINNLDKVHFVSYIIIIIYVSYI